MLLKCSLVYIVLLGVDFLIDVVSSFGAQLYKLSVPLLGTWPQSSGTMLSRQYPEGLGQLEMTVPLGPNSTT